MTMHRKTPATDTVLVSFNASGGVATLAIDRPDSGNRLDAATIRALCAALDRAEADPAVRVIVLTGSGDCFCKGGEPDGFPGGDTPAQLDYAEAFIQLIGRMMALRCPIVAKVNGDVLAGGLSLLEACDIAIAADHCRFGYPEIEKGTFPMLAMAVTRRALPSKLSFELFYTGRILSSDEALTAWMINESVPAGDLDRAVSNWTARLADKRAASLGLGRVGFHAMGSMTAEARLRYAQVMMTTVFNGVEADRANS